MPVVPCERCGVKLSENSMKFHRQVCGSTQKPQCSHCGRRFDADALSVHEAICGDRSAPTARNASPKAASKPSEPSAVPSPGAASAHSDAAARRLEAPPTADHREGVSNPQPKRRDENAMRRSLAELREEVYGTKPSHTNPPSSAAPARGSVVSTSSVDDDFDARGRREPSNPPRSGNEPRRQLRRAPSPQDEQELRSSRSHRAVDRDREHDGRASDTGYYAEPSGAEQSPPQSDMGSFDSTKRSSAAKYAAVSSHVAPPSTSSPELGQMQRALSDLKAASIDQAKRMDRLDDVVQSIRRDVDELIRVQHRTRDDVDALRNRKENPSHGSAAAEEVRTDLHNLGRHVDVLRDELDGVRTEATRHRRDIDERLTSLSRASAEYLRRFKDLDADLAEIRSAKEVPVANDLQLAVETLGQQVAVLMEESERQSKERESQQLIRRDVKYIGRDLDAMQDELKYLRRQLDNDRRRIDQAVVSSHGNSTPRRAVVNQHTSPIHAPKDASPPIEYEQHRVAQRSADLRKPPSARELVVMDDDADTYVVGVPPKRDNETESLVVRAMSTNRPRGSVVSAPAYRGYSSSRGSSVSSTGGHPPPVAQVHLTGRRM